MRGGRSGGDDDATDERSRTGTDLFSLAPADIKKEAPAIDLPIATLMGAARCGG